MCLLNSVAYLKLRVEIVIPDNDLLFPHYMLYLETNILYSCEVKWCELRIIVILTLIGYDYFKLLPLCSDIHATICVFCHILSNCGENICFLSP